MNTCLLGTRVIKVELTFITKLRQHENHGENSKGPPLPYSRNAGEKKKKATENPSDPSALSRLKPLHAGCNGGKISDVAKYTYIQRKILLYFIVIFGFLYPRIF